MYRTVECWYSCRPCTSFPCTARLLPAFREIELPVAHYFLGHYLFHIYYFLFCWLLPQSLRCYIPYQVVIFGRDCREVPVKVTDTPATYSFGHVVALAALDMVQPWAELDVAGVGLSFANWMAVVIAPYIVFVLMLHLLHFVFRSRVACLWIGPRLALAARCG